MPKALSPWTVTHLPEIAAVLLAAVIGTTVWVNFEYRQEVAAVQHSLEAEKKLSQLLSTVQDAETGNRGFLLTGDDSYLQVYDRAVSEIAGELDAVHNLIAGDPQLQGVFVNLRPVVERRLSLLREGIELRRREGLDAAIRFIRTNRGREAMMSVRIGIAEMEAIEAGLLRERSAKAQRLTQAGSIMAAGGIVLVILSLAGWIWNIRRDARKLAAETAERLDAEAQLRQMQKIEALGQLTGGIAHDFNNMLAVIISGLSLIKRRIRPDDAALPALIDAAMDGANRAAALTSRLMTFSRQQQLAPQTVDANRLIDGMAEMLDRILGETMRVETGLAAGLWLTRADPSQLENALVNLCVNARDAMAEGGTLNISTDNVELDSGYGRQNDVPAGQYVLISVTDTGMGMSPDVLARAFDPFFTTKDTGKGTGLGLSQVHGFVKQSGGHVMAYSEPGHGTSIKIYLPRQHGAAAADWSGVAKARPARVGGKIHNILVVEDDTRVRELTVSMLRELGYTVIHADGAAAALRHLDTHPNFDLLFTDIVMPETDGRKLAGEALLRQPDLKVLFTTGFNRHAVLHGGVLNAGDHFIAKPFTIDRLAAKLSEVLDGGGAD